MAQALDWQDVQGKVLGGQEISNEEFAALLPHLAAGNAGQALEASGALLFLGEDNSLQVRRVAATCSTLNSLQPASLIPHCSSHTWLN